MSDEFGWAVEVWSAQFGWDVWCSAQFGWDVWCSARTRSAAMAELVLAKREGYDARIRRLTAAVSS